MKHLHLQKEQGMVAVRLVQLWGGYVDGNVRYNRNTDGYLWSSTNYGMQRGYGWGTLFSKDIITTGNRSRGIYGRSFKLLLVATLTRMGCARTRTYMATIGIGAYTYKTSQGLI